MPSSIKSAIEKMDRLELALLAAEAEVKAMNARAASELETITGEVAKLTEKYQSERPMH